MPLPTRCLAPRFARAVAALAAATALPALAATPPPTPSVAIVKVEKGASVRKADPNAKDTEFPRQGAGNSTITTKTTSDRGEVTYIISLHNFSNFPAKGIVVEYHFYNITRSTGRNVADVPIITEVKSIENVDIDAGKTKDVETKPVPYEITQNQYTTTTPAGYNVTPYGPTVNNNGYNVSPDTVQTTMSSTSTTTSALGYHVEIRFNGKVLKSDEVPGDLTDKLKNVYHYKSTDKPAS